MQSKQSNNELTPSSRTSVCDECTDLVDGRYCLFWHDVVPDEVKKNGCEEANTRPPF